MTGDWWYQVSVVHVGVDVGGTFTDVFLLEADGSTATSIKSPTSRPDPTLGIIAGLERLRELRGLAWDDVATVTVGSTLALNAVIEGRGSKTALITTAGFRDVLEIARESRQELYNLQHQAQRPLVPRSLRCELTERVSAWGEVLTPIDLQAQQAALLTFLDQEQIASVAISFINSYVNPIHEQRVREMLVAERPQLFVSASIDVHRHYREYERTLVTCMNAYVGPIMTDYLEKLEGSIRALAPQATVRVTDSLGGAMNLAAAERRPVLTMMSGPASGVMGAVRAATQVHGDVSDRSMVTMDMGGTSCDVAVIEQGAPEIATGITVGLHSFSLASVDVHSIGAGGGTIAWVDDGGLLRVGPESTGSVPGPACYGKGGELPTVTDAHLVLGHLAVDQPLGGEIVLDVKAATRVIERHVAVKLGLSVVEAAAGILRVADASMHRAIESMTVRRGLDPRSCELVAFGGAAPLHAPGIVDALGIERVIVPRFAGVLSAMGAVWAPEHYEAARTSLQQTRSLRHADLLLIIKELERIALEMADVDDGRTLSRSVHLDMRFVGQTSHLRVSLDDPDDPQALETAHRRFVARYSDVFGYVLPEAESEVENIRVRMTVEETQRALSAPQVATESAQSRPWRAVFDGSAEIPCRLYRLDEAPGRPSRIDGPAVVVGEGATALVWPGQFATVDDFGNLVVHSPGRAEQ